MATTTKGYPYPLPADPAQAGADNIKALAQQVDATVPFRTWTGAAVVALNNAATGAVVVTFPAGRFTQPPRVLLGILSSGTYFAGYSGITATSCTITVRHYKDTLATLSATVSVMAVQVLTTGSDG